MKRHFLLLSAALFILSSCGDGSESSKHDDTPGKVGTENSVPCETGDRKLTICADETGGFQNYQCEEGFGKGTVSAFIPNVPTVKSSSSHAVKKTKESRRCPVKREHGKRAASVH